MDSNLLNPYMLLIGRRELAFPMCTSYIKIHLVRKLGLDFNYASCKDKESESCHGYGFGPMGMISKGTNWRENLCSASPLMLGPGGVNFGR